jgi:hypothetical protein
MTKEEIWIEENLTDKSYRDDLKVGDTVKWVNDFGVEWENKVIGFNYDRDYNKDYKKFIHLDTSGYWFPHGDEDILAINGNEIRKNKLKDLLLNNGKIAKLIGCDDFSNLKYKVQIVKDYIELVLVDGLLHSFNDFGEPIKPVSNEFQPTS